MNDGRDAERGILDHLVDPIQPPLSLASVNLIWGKAACGQVVGGKRSWRPSPPGASVTCPRCFAAVYK